MTPRSAMRAFVLLSLLTLGLARAATAPLTADERRAALQTIERTIQSAYVFPELRAPLVARLEASAHAGRYALDDANAFAARVTEDLNAVAHDGHLYLTADSAEYAAAIAPPKSEHGLDAYRRALAVRENHGIAGQDVLSGNVRYLKLTAFRWVPGGVTAKMSDQAARFLREGDAVIIDLRGNGGGNSDAADYFGKVLVPHASGTPFYILVDGHVGSAAEAVTYGVQQAKRGTVVGSTTYGAANNNKKVPIAPGFILSVSYHRPINPISGTNWEGVGVQPDLPVPASQALDAAHHAALLRLANASTDAQRLAEYRYADIAVAARLHPVALAAQELAAYAGTYGTITINSSPRALIMNRSDRPRWQKDLLLSPLTADGLFSVEGADDDLRVRFFYDRLDLLHGSEDASEPFPKQH